jgi:chromosome partitioning protein
LNSLGVSAAFDGKPMPIAPVECTSPLRAPNLHLLAGHANLSAYDAALTFAQTSNNAITTLQNLPGAFPELLRLTEDKYQIDFTIVDLNPSLSAINQNLFLTSTAFIIPTNPDPFSIMALDTLTTILPRWVGWKRGAVDLFADSAYPLGGGTPKFIGSLIQRFNIRNGKAARPYRDNIEEINANISGKFFSALSTAGMTFPPDDYGALAAERYCLGAIPDFQGLLPKSSNAGVPVFDLTDAEINEKGPILDNAKERRGHFNGLFEKIGNQIVATLASA